MGYSISTRARTPQLRDEMVEFMAKHWQPFGELAGWGVLDRARDMQPPHGEVFTTKKSWSDTIIGFEYPSWLGGDGPRTQIYSAMCFIALQIGREHTFRPTKGLCHQGFEGRAPFYLYADSEYTPVLMTGRYPRTKSTSWMFTDRNGFRGQVAEIKALAHMQKKNKNKPYILTDAQEAEVEAYVQRRIERAKIEDALVRKWLSRLGKAWRSR